MGKPPQRFLTPPNSVLCSGLRYSELIAGQTKIRKGLSAVSLLSSSVQVVLRSFYRPIKYNHEFFDVLPSVIWRICEAELSKVQALHAETRFLDDSKAP